MTGCSSLRTTVTLRGVHTWRVRTFSGTLITSWIVDKFVTLERWRVAIRVSSAPTLGRSPAQPRIYIPRYTYFNSILDQESCVNRERNRGSTAPLGALIRSAVPDGRLLQPLWVGVGVPSCTRYVIGYGCRGNVSRDRDGVTYESRSSRGFN